MCAGRLVVLVLLFGSCLGLGCRDGPGQRPHIIFISVDTLRADHLSLNGYARATSPAIDAFALQAWRFSEGVTVIPKTGPSIATMFTGRHPAEHGVRSNPDPVPAGLPMLPEILQSHGYRTAAFVGNATFQEKLGYARGFETHLIFTGEEGIEKLNKAFLDWAQQAWDRPTFVWLHYLDPHGPSPPRTW